jgi:hypothetical protein
MNYKEDEVQRWSNPTLVPAFLSAKARKRGVYGKGPKPFQTEERLKFMS